MQTRTLIKQGSNCWFEYRFIGRSPAWLSARCQLVQLVQRVLPIVACVRVMLHCDFKDKPLASMRKTYPLQYLGFRSHHTLSISRKVWTSSPSPSCNGPTKIHNHDCLARHERQPIVESDPPFANQICAGGEINHNLSQVNDSPIPNSAHLALFPTLSKKKVVRAP